MLRSEYKVRDTTEFLALKNTEEMHQKSHSSTDLMSGFDFCGMAQYLQAPFYFFYSVFQFFHQPAVSTLGRVKSCRSVALFRALSKDNNIQDVSLVNDRSTRWCIVGCARTEWANSLAKHVNKVAQPPTDLLGEGDYGSARILTPRGVQNLWCQGMMLSLLDAFKPYKI